MEPLEALLAPLMRLRDECVNAAGAEEHIELLELIREAKRQVGDLVRDCERAAAETFAGQREWRIGRYKVEVRGSDTRKWHNDDLRQAVARIARFDPDTGEERTTDECVRIFAAAYRCSGNEIRKTWLKEHDLDIDEYSYDAIWRDSIRIIQLDPEASE